MIAFTFPPYFSIFDTKFKAYGEKSEVDPDELAKDCGKICFQLGFKICLFAMRYPVLQNLFQPIVASLSNPKMRPERLVK